MECPNCKEDIKDSSIYCNNCGCKLKTSSPKKEKSITGPLVLTFIITFIVTIVCNAVMCFVIIKYGNNN